MSTTSLMLLAAAVTAAAATACEPHDLAAQAPEPGAMVTGTSYHRSGSGREAHYVECTTSAGARFRVLAAADVAYSILDGQPCPDGPREPMPQDKYPELYEELQKQLPYGGGDKWSECGEWQTVDKEEARRWAKSCPPLLWGDIS